MTAAEDGVSSNQAYELFGDWMFIYVHKLTYYQSYANVNL